MITNYVSLRTFNIRYKNGTGTAFTIDRDERQYLITARHVVPGIEDGDVIQIYRDDKWMHLPIYVIGIGEGDIDITVLSSPLQISPITPLVASKDGMGLAQTVYILGYPFGLNAGKSDANLDLPLPFVKSGIISAMTGSNPRIIYIDGHGNPGFSGGPVVFRPLDSKDLEVELRVAGIVSHFPECSTQRVYDGSGKWVGSLLENPGIICAIDIDHAIEMIDANPIGFKLPANQVWVERQC